ncbi:hypothetical protein LQ318_07115 [Aliifodinibius salicampi]|uniref:CHAT domain-containing protein n=1 Tax=Fodinibius salicampi TaxID=1920655 RepID=A0ABT3PXT4_9BACT|nr:hypothetical protein [Fodinibius salicampi]MCW9712670.1 hypothetical protein [Fodinibius salicampi]
MSKNFQTISTYDSLVLIESLGINDNKTGLQLGQKLKTYCDNNNIVVSYLSVSNRNQFIATLNQINDDILNGTNQILSGGAKYPILHLDIHGSERGLHLSNGDLIEWDDFASVCRNINNSTKNNLIIVLAVCKGYKSIVNITPKTLTPYYALIGPEKIVYEKDIERLFPKFYLKLFKTNILTDAIKLLKPEYHLYHCEMVFANAYSKYIREKCRGEGKEERLEELIDKFKKMNPHVENYSEVRELLVDLIKPRKESYNKFRHRFLLSNLRVNKDRFSVDLDDILDIIGREEST